MCIQTGKRHHQNVSSVIFCFGDFTNFWVCLIYFQLLHLIHNSKGHKHSGLFCTKLQVLWFLTLFILPVKPEISMILAKFICKAVLNKSIYSHLYQFCCIFRALWPVTTLVTWAPMPIHPTHWVTIASFQPFTALNYSVLHKFMCLTSLTRAKCGTRSTLC